MRECEGSWLCRLVMRKEENCIMFPTVIGFFYPMTVKWMSTCVSGTGTRDPPHPKIVSTSLATKQKLPCSWSGSHIPCTLGCPVAQLQQIWGRESHLDYSILFWLGKPLEKCEFVSFQAEVDLQSTSPTSLANVRMIELSGGKWQIPAWMFKTDFCVLLHILY